MRQETSFLKRFIAMALALLLLVSNANLGAVLQVSAAEHDHDHADPTKTYGQIIAENYDLTEAEKNLLTSGMLAGDGTFSYQVPADGDNLIAIDTDAKKITVAKFGDWAIDHAYIMVGNEVKETVTMTNGVGTYTFDGKAFSVKVDFTLNTEIAKDVQETLLNTAAWLKQGIANLEAIAAQSGNLSILETAMPELVTLSKDENAGFGRMAKNKINALNDQMTANGGKLDLSVMVEEYNTAASKVQYLLTNGAAMKAEVEALAGDLSYIDSALEEAVVLLKETLAEAEEKMPELEQELADAKENLPKVQEKLAEARDALTEAQDALSTAQEALESNTVPALEAQLQEKVNELETAVAELETAIAELEDAEKQLQDGIAEAEDIKAQVAELENMLPLAETLYNCVNTLYTELNVVVDADWTVLDADKGANLLKNADYAALDKLVAELGATSAVSVKESLWVADASVIANMAMFTVTAKVILETVNEENVVAVYDTMEVPVILEENATKDAIAAEIAASGIEADALAAWADVIVEGKYATTKTELPEVLTADIDYVVTISPVEFEVKLADEVQMLPYGYQLKLPSHDTNGMVYDYFIDGEKYAQGDIITIEDNMVIGRVEGEAYKNYDLYSIVAKLYGNNVTKAILTSGALYSDVIKVREPAQKDAEELMLLYKGALTAQKFDASYNDLFWAPYSYSAGETTGLFNGSLEATLDESVKSASVVYRLTLSNYSVAEIQAILDLPAALLEDAAAQANAFNRLLNQQADLNQLNYSILSALNSMIDTTELNANAQKDAALKAAFKAVVSDLMNQNTEKKSNLTVCNILNNYTNGGGLEYYYQNSEYVREQVSSLAQNISRLVDADAQFTSEEKQAALVALLNVAGKGDYVEKISRLSQAMAEVNAALTIPNEKIDVNSKNLYKLIDAFALTAEGENQAADFAYLDTKLNAVDDSQRLITVSISFNGEKVSESIEVEKNTAIPAEKINALKEMIAANEIYGNEDMRFYELKITDAEGNELNDLNDLVGKSIETNIQISYKYDLRQYTVKIDGEADQIITVNERRINLPVHPDSDNYRYEYTIDGQDKITLNAYTFTVEQLIELFVDDVYTITREEIDKNAEDFENIFGGGTQPDDPSDDPSDDPTDDPSDDPTDDPSDDPTEGPSDEEEEEKFEWSYHMEDKKPVGLDALIPGTPAGFMAFAQEVVALPYAYVALNGEPLIDTVGDDRVLTMQTLINAILADNDFGTDTILNLQKNNGGLMMTAQMDMGVDANDIKVSVEFKMIFKSAPEQLAMVANGLTKIKPYMTFQSNNGIMDVNVTLPEKVYEAYLTALLATENLNKEKMDAINSEIAFQFLWDYVDIVINSDANTETFNNTLAMLGVDRDLTGYEDYYQMAKKALTNDGVVINPVDDNTDVDISVTGQGKKAINGLLGLLGLDISQYQGLIYECKVDSAQLSVNARANLTNTDTVFEAVVVDFDQLKADGLRNKAKGYDFAADAAARISAITGESMVMLLSDVDDNLVFNGSAILDLNGKTVNGNIIVNDGTLIIIDSTLGDATAGTVNGNIGGNVKIMAGQYAYDVSDLLVAGYVYEDGYVHNQLYIMSADVTTTYGLNAADIKNIAIDVKTKLLESGKMDYIEFALALSADVAVDMIFNYLNSAAFAIATDKYVADGEHYDTNNDGFHDVYDIQFTDLIGLLESSNKKADLVQKVLDSINIDELDGFVNEILYDLLDFATIKAAIENDDVIASYGLKTSPFMVQVEHITDGDYLTFGITSNPAKIKYSNIGLKVGSETARKYLLMLVEELDRIVKVGKAEVKLDEIGTTVNARGVEIPVVNGGATVDFRVDLTAGDYDYVGRIAEILGRENNEAFKAAFDATSLGDIVDKLESYIEANSKIEGRVEDIALDVLNVVTKVLKRLDIEDKNFGILETEEYGAYDIGPVVKHGENRVRGIFENIDLNVYLWVKLFKKDVEDEDCTHVPGEIVIENEVAADCVNEGSYDEVVYCTVCGEELSRNTITVPALGHKAGEAVKENEVAADCVTEGSYDEVVYCSVCGEELRRETITVPALGHTAGETVIENKVDADCVNKGSYDEVVYCSVCGEELSRKTVVVDALGHTEAAAVIENEVAADCVNDGSYDEVVYCSVCGEELSRKTVVVDALGHTAGETVIENKVDADCVTDGSYDEVVYCSVCGEELSRETIVVDALGHTAGEIVIENRVESTCTVAGSYDEVVYCEVCDEELGRETKTLPLAEHTAGKVEIENEVEPDCVTEGSYDEVVYCSVCGEELSRDTITVPALGHTAGETVIENRVESTCTEAGSYDEVVYCDVCGEELSRKTVELPLAAHVDEDPRDHICDICGAGPLEDCYDHDLDGFCDWCGRYICKCGVDEDRDHHCDICGRRISWCRDCDRDHYCDICGLQLTCCIDFNRNNKCDICGKYMNTVGEVIRIGGDVRSETARMIADELKAVLGVDKFDAIVYAVGDVYADALTGTYLANMENAPILLYRAAQVEKNLNYIVKNLSADGVVYILGDVGAIPASVEEGLVAAGIKVVRLGGLTRYETNLEILDATVFDGGETVLVCTGNEYPDALAASATGMPILLVNNKIGHLKDSQIEYLNSLANKCNFVLIGGEGAISPALAAELAGYDVDGTVDRIGGKTRYETCVMIADAFFADAEKVVVAYGREFPDALCGGTLAYALNAPIILVQESRATFAAFYLDSKDINSGYVLGGTGRISDKVACKVFRLVGPHEMIVR